MRTDDFDEIKPQDTSGGIPDVVEAEEADEFSNFDGGSGQGGKSLGELFSDNPILKIALVGVGVVAVVTALFMFGGSSKKADLSDIGSVVNEGEAPGKVTSETYRNAVDDKNQQSLENALRTGQSAIPIPTASPESGAVNPQPEEPPVALEDPLDGWRAAAQSPVQKTPDPVLNRPAASGQVPARQALGPDPAAVDALSQAMAAQMKAILDKHAINGSQIIQVTSLEKETSTSAASSSDSAGNVDVASTQEQEVEILIPAGTIAYAQTLTEANSDAPGPVLARIASGPLAGSRILGSFQQSEEYLTLNFNTVVVNGVSHPVNAVALDPKTTLPAVASEVDHRYWRRFILPAAARFIQGMADAISQREQTSVSVSGDTVTSSKPDLKPKEELAAGLSDGTGEVADELRQMGTDTKILVKVHAGTPVGILFLEPVLKED